MEASRRMKSSQPRNRTQVLGVVKNCAVKKWPFPFSRSNKKLALEYFVVGILSNFCLGRTWIFREIILVCEAHRAGRISRCQIHGCSVGQASACEEIGEFLGQWQQFWRGDAQGGRCVGRFYGLPGDRLMKIFFTIFRSETSRSCEAERVRGSSRGQIGDAVSVKADAGEETGQFLGGERQWGG